MDSLLSPQARARVVERIAGLQPQTRPAWGRLSCAQMLVHCQRGFQLARGDLRPRRRLIGRLLGGLAKRRYVLGPAPFAHGLPTDPAFQVTDTGDFEHERAELIRLVHAFADPATPSAEAHPFFGSMTRANWDRLMAKHLDHHLRQFGA